MVEGEGALKAVYRDHAAGDEGPGVVDENVEAIVALAVDVGEGAHLSLRGEIGEEVFDGGVARRGGDGGDGSLGARRVATYQDDPHAAPRKPPRGR